MKRASIILLLTLLTILLAGCAPGMLPEEDEPEQTECPHLYLEATCKAPKTCTRCGEQEGEPAGHKWSSATCLEPRTCRTCGETRGEKGEHKLAREPGRPASCVKDGVTDGEFCTLCKTVIKEQEVIPAAHQFRGGTCEACGEQRESLTQFDVSLNGDGAVIAYLYAVEGADEYALYFEGTGATRDFVTSSTPYNSVQHKIKYVEFGEGITRIGNCTLFEWDYWELKRLVLPSTLKEIGSCAFQYMDIADSMGELRLPESLEKIGSAAFEWAKIGKLVISDSVAIIGDNAFNSAYITEIDFGTGLKQLGDEAFAQHFEQNKILTSLKKTEYGNGYYVGDKENPYYMFVAVKNNEITSLEFHPDTEIIYDRSLTDCLFLKSLVIPDKVWNIGSMAFLNCSSLERLQIGTGLAWLQSNAFTDCAKLTEATILSEKISYIDSAVFARCHALQTVHFVGTKSQWNSIPKSGYWNILEQDEWLSLTIRCSDGNITT